MNEDQKEDAGPQLDQEAVEGRGEQPVEGKRSDQIDHEISGNGETQGDIADCISCDSRISPKPDEQNVEGDTRDDRDKPCTEGENF